jgi:hypothetical protein
MIIFVAMMVFLGLVQGQTMIDHDVTSENTVVDVDGAMSHLRSASSLDRQLKHGCKS